MKARDDIDFGRTLTRFLREQLTITIRMIVNLPGLFTCNVPFDLLILDLNARRNRCVYVGVIHYKCDITNVRFKPYPCLVVWYDMFNLCFSRLPGIIMWINCISCLCAPWNGISHVFRDPATCLTFADDHQHFGRDLFERLRRVVHEFIVFSQFCVEGGQEAVERIILTRLVSEWGMFVLQVLTNSQCHHLT